jgi:hypothetical protein
MAYYTTDIIVTRVDPTSLGLLVTAQTAHVDKVIQCYVCGLLVDWQRPQGGQVRFVLPNAGAADTIALLAVDVGEERTDYWSAAVAAATGPGGLAGGANRIEVRFRRDLADGRQPGDVWRVYRGNAGDAAAAVGVYEGPVYPGGRGATGWGFDWGYGGWGRSGSNAPGWGHIWGDTWGYEVDYLECLTDPLPRGTYPLRVEVADAHGNVSDAFQTVVVVDTYPSPAQDLAVCSYDPDDDVLTLTMTPSRDIA